MKNLTPFSQNAWMENDWNVVVLCHQTDVLGPGDSAENTGLLIHILYPFPGHERSSTIGKLKVRNLTRR